MKGNLKDLSLIVMGAAIGAMTYDLAIKLKISYNEREPGMFCNNGIAFEQIDPGSTVYLKTDKECINETEKGKRYDNTSRKQSTKN
jgi:hypothetical protein